MVDKFYKDNLEIILKKIITEITVKSFPNKLNKHNCHRQAYY